MTAYNDCSIQFTGSEFRNFNVTRCGPFTEIGGTENDVHETGTSKFVIFIDNAIGLVLAQGISHIVPVSVVIQIQSGLCQNVSCVAGIGIILRSSVRSRDGQITFAVSVDITDDTHIQAKLATHLVAADSGAFALGQEVVNGNTVFPGYEIAGTENDNYLSSTTITIRVTDNDIGNVIAIEIDHIIKSLICFIPLIWTGNGFTESFIAVVLFANKYTFQSVGIIGGKLEFSQIKISFIVWGFSQNDINCAFWGSVGVYVGIRSADCNILSAVLVKVRNTDGAFNMLATVADDSYTRYIAVTGYICR